MKIDRLIGILTILLQHQKVTAPYLAEKFEVSRRTINRDIEDLCKAGIPVVTLQGAKGGISIAEGFTIDKTLFTKEELKSIFAGLNSLDSVAETAKYRQLISKFSDGKDHFVEANHILIDLSSHYKDTLAPKITTIGQGIENRNVIAFDYFNSAGEEKRLLEPYFVVFQWSSWYVFGFCQIRREFRLFKLNRLWNLVITNQGYELKPIPSEELDFQQYFSEEITLVALFDKRVKYRLIEEYGMDCFSHIKDGRLHFERSFTNMDYLKNWILGFGDQVQVIEPKPLIAEIKRDAENILKKSIR